MSYSPITFKGASRQLSANYQNVSGSTIAGTAPVSADASSQITLVDVSNEASVLNMVGYTVGAIANNAFGQVASAGRVENIATSYAVGTPVWIGTTPGTLTNIKPDLSQAGWTVGMFVIFAGLIVKNEVSPAQKDLSIATQIIGQLG